MNIVRRLPLLAPAAFLLTACSSTEPNAMHRISVSAAIASAGVHPSPGINANLIVSGAGRSLSISSAQMVLSRLKLANNQACADSSDDDVDEGGGHDSTSASAAHDSADVGDDDSTGDHHDDDSTEAGEDSSGHNHDEDSTHHEEGDHDEGCVPLKAGPVLVDLPLDGTTKVILDALVPAGTYTRLQARLHPVDTDDAGAGDFLAAHPDFAGISVKVVGVFTDSGGTNHDFTFTSPLNVVTSMNFDPPVTVNATTTNLTIDVDVSSWFKDASGAVIDPTNSMNEHWIEKNIRASLRAFRDDNHDGDDDHSS